MAYNATVGTQTSQYEFSSMSGVDIKAMFQGKVIASIQSLSYSMQREIAPIFTMGSQFPRAYGHGKVGIAGTLSFSFIDRNELLFAMREAAALGKLQLPWLDREDQKPTLFGDNNVPAPIVGVNDLNLDTTTGVTRIDNQVNPTSPTDPYVYVGEDDLENSFIDDQVQTLPIQVTDIPPFTITLVGSNEYGKTSTMSLHGVKIMSEAYSISIDHITSDMAFNFLALSVTPWTPVVRP